MADSVSKRIELPNHFLQERSDVPLCLSLAFTSEFESSPHREEPLAWSLPSQCAVREIWLQTPGSRWMEQVIKLITRSKRMALNHHE